MNCILSDCAAVSTEVVDPYADIQPAARPNGI